jgi:hypothetical protein
MDEERNVRALVVYESYFGNTKSIARAIARGLRLEHATASALDVTDTHIDLESYDLLVAGGPTHAFALSRPHTRDEAAARGGDIRYASRGLREWLTDLPDGHRTRLAASFDTRVSKVRHLPMSAARSAAHLLRQRRWTLLGRPTGFVVQDVEGPLEQREIERAVAWGRSLAREAQQRVETRPHMRQESGSQPLAVRSVTIVDRPGAPGH